MTRDRPFLEDGGHIDFLTTLCTQGARESYQYVSISVAILAKACGLVFLLCSLHKLLATILLQ